MLSEIARARARLRTRDAEDAVPKVRGKPSVRPGVTGMSQKGNTCYIVSVLQALSSCSPLVRVLTEIEKNSTAEKTPLSSALAQLFERKWATEIESTNFGEMRQAVSWSSVHDTLTDTFGSLIDGSQQDAAEFLSLLIYGGTNVAGLQVEMLQQASDVLSVRLLRADGPMSPMTFLDLPELTSPPPANTSVLASVSECKNGDDEEDQHVVAQTRQGSSKGEEKHLVPPAGKGGKERNDEEDQRLVAQAQKGSSKSEERHSAPPAGQGGKGKGPPLLPSHKGKGSKGEPPPPPCNSKGSKDGKGKPFFVRCEYSFSEVAAASSTDFWVDASNPAPDVLILVIKRNTGMLASWSSQVRNRERKDVVKFPLHGLDLRSLLHPDCPVEGFASPAYSLAAVVNHEGSDFTCYVRPDSYRGWILCDDHRVYEIENEDAVVSGDAYILFYCLCSAEEKSWE